MREFKVALLQLAICTLACGAYAEEAEIFKSPIAGLEFTKPPGWHYATASQHFENIRAIRPDDSEIHREMQENSTLPEVILMKFPEPYAGVNPSFKIAARPYGDFKGMEPKKLLEMVLPVLRKAFSDLKLVQSPMHVDLAGVTAGYARMTYTMNIADGGTFGILSEMWLVPREDFFLIIGAGMRQDEENAIREEIASIIKTLKLYH